ncbi:hypothetical protein [Corynebacterium heidelbergense]|uniref:Secreted protein n=1 Tax=Corynebacterium heidelbergense TaxID=2055947 RepID=A0A364V9D3_9CORY|nr:hypothetical protein [Corynebacterium heidelbergense]RAV33224.1 hypothetical protein CWC39_09640 [Corynebacterium heidelbergense]WCZ37052.1 hypothetical protein CHEID_07595 [Corynebacterium heidelbergense]
MKRTATRAAGIALALAAVVGGAGTAAAQSSGSSVPSSSTFGDGRPWWDPTQVIESPVDPGHSEGEIPSVSFTDDTDGDHSIPARVPGHLNEGGERYARVQSTATGFAPGKFYTVRITLREAGSGKDWGVYTWQTYKATDDGKLNINLRVSIPTRASEGEKVVAAPAVYSADDVGRDGRPNKVDESCVLQCKTVPPLAAWTDYNNADSIITIGPAA